MAPNVASPPADADWVTLADLPRLEGSLDRIQRVYGSHKRFPIYLTEYGFDTNPPQLFNSVSPATQATYLNQAEYMAWRDPRVQTLSQYLLKDERLVDGARYSAFASGLEFINGTAKPSLAAYRLPIWMPSVRIRRGHSLEVWGCVRPAKRYPPGAIGLVLIQLNGRAVRSVKITNPSGYFDVRVTFPRSGTVRLAWRLHPRSIRIQPLGEDHPDVPIRALAVLVGPRRGGARRPLTGPTLLAPRDPERSQARTGYRRSPSRRPSMRSPRPPWSWATTTSVLNLKTAERGCDFEGGADDPLVVGDELHAGLLGDGDICGVGGCQPVCGPPGDAQQLRLEHLEANLPERRGELLELDSGQVQRRAATFNSSSHSSCGASTRSSPSSNCARRWRATSTCRSPSEWNHFRTTDASSAASITGRRARHGSRRWTRRRGAAANSRSRSRRAACTPGVSPGPRTLAPRRVRRAAPGRRCASARVNSRRDRCVAVGRRRKRPEPCS